MKRKLTFVGVGAVLILAAIIVIAGRGGLGNEKRRMNDEMVLSPEGKLVVQPGERSKVTFVVNGDAGSKSTSNPAPPR
jgi:Na+-transporting methylmalonyl-CoA/oxaloacetate decarboxylase gamma subunit